MYNIKLGTLKYASLTGWSCCSFRGDINIWFGCSLDVSWMAFCWFGNKSNNAMHRPVSTTNIRFRWNRDSWFQYWNIKKKLWAWFVSWCTGIVKHEFTARSHELWTFEWTTHTQHSQHVNVWIPLELIDRSLNHRFLFSRSTEQHCHFVLI